MYVRSRNGLRRRIPIIGGLRISPPSPLLQSYFRILMKGMPYVNNLRKNTVNLGIQLLYNWSIHLANV
jgi:hypothetical protein